MPNFQSEKSRKLAALWLLDPAQAKAIVVRELHRTDGSITETAKALDVSISTVKLWVRRNPDLRQSVAVIRQVAKIRDENG